MFRTKKIEFRIVKNGNESVFKPIQDCLFENCLVIKQGKNRPLIKACPMAIVIGQDNVCDCAYC